MATRIRWDRVGRVALLCVAALVLYLYIGPTSAWISTFHESKRRSADLAALKRENERLVARRDELQKPETLERIARELGMVRAAEKAYVVKGLPAE
ncbi:MAG: septum formation initiator family protein [Solirubrobacteraceae bacterium]